MGRFSTTKAKVAYVTKRWPALKGNARGILLTVWREFYGDAFDGVRDNPVDARAWTTTAARIVCLPSLAEVTKIVERARRAEIKKELAEAPPIPYYATRDN